MRASKLPLLIDSDAVLGNIPPQRMVDALARGHLRPRGAAPLADSTGGKA
jgi:hypothetical protein